VSGNYDIILIALVAIFLVLRLRSVLGKRTGNERPPARDPFTPPAPPPAARGDAPAGSDNVVQMPGTTPSQRAPAGTTGPGAIRATVLPTATAGVSAIRGADPEFDAAGFAAGARFAFGMIVEAFARGDAKALKPLLDAGTYTSFEKAIRDREAAGEKSETTLIGFEASDISAAELRGATASVTVRFVTEQINAVRNSEGLVVDGNPNEVQKVVDLWTFERDTGSRDPNWFLVRTDSEG